MARYGGFAHRRSGGGSGKAAHAVRYTQAQAERAWRRLAAAAAALALGEVHGPGLLNELLEARRGCVGAALPVEGEDAKAAAMALLELARTCPVAGEDRRGWHLTAMRGVALHCEALLDQARNASMAGFRSQTGSD